MSACENQTRSLPGAQDTGTQDPPSLTQQLGLREAGAGGGGRDGSGCSP